MVRPIMSILLCLLTTASLADRKAELDWRSDPMMIALISISGKSMTLKDISRQLEIQTSVEFYADRRYADKTASLQITSAPLETVMTCIEDVTGLEWRLVDDMFFLTEDARGTAVVRWKERYEEARKRQIARTTETRVQQWLYDTMPFPPSFDPVWELTPLQREQIAYQNALTVATMTRPQLDWLNLALLSKGFRPPVSGIPTDILVQRAPDLEVKLNTAMVIDSPQGMLIIEKPLTPSPTNVEEPSPTEPVEARTITVDLNEPAKDASLPTNLSGIWITDSEPLALPDLLRAAKERKFDNVFVPVLSRGRAIYPSRALQPNATQLTGEDRLQPILDAADRLGMKVHAVLDTTLWGDARHPPPIPASYAAVQERNLLDRTYSEEIRWRQTEMAALEGNEGDTTELPATDKTVYLCPASSQTARLLRAVAGEIVSKYDVAGVCLDRLEYPRSEPFVVNGRDLSVPFGYTIEVRKSLIRAHQVDPIDVDPEGVRSPADLEAQVAWERFRRGKLTGLIGEVGSAIKDLDPDVVFSVTLDIESDAQSPGHWAQVADIDAVLPTVRLDDTEGGPVADKVDVQSAHALYAAVSKYAAVVPIIYGTDTEKIADLATALKSANPEREWILHGGSAELVKTLEGLTGPRK